MALLTRTETDSSPVVCHQARQPSTADSERRACRLEQLVDVFGRGELLVGADRPAAAGAIVFDVRDVAAAMLLKLGPPAV